METFTKLTGDKAQCTEVTTDMIQSLQNRDVEIITHSIDGRGQEVKTSGIQGKFIQISPANPNIVEFDNVGGETKLYRLSNIIGIKDLATKAEWSQ